VEGTPDGNVTLWGLIFDTVPIKARSQAKIVWRMTGSGPLTVAAFKPDGRMSPLLFGPDYHESSDYHRPGQEWGTGFTFDVAGCWRIELSRTQGRATVYFEVRTRRPRASPGGATVAPA
jgi:hypothetical protein